jgi:phosphoribosylaminoimidazole-succinocarboxamide synthase
MMAYEKKGLLYSGKVKSLYETQSKEYLIAHFRDDTTAFDGEKCEKLGDKGKINNLISSHIMKILAEAGVPTHYVEMLGPDEVLVKRLQMIQLESVVRNIAAGSLCRRLGVPQAQVLSAPLYEIFLKNDELHDPMVTDEHALAFGWATKDQLNQMHELTLAINQVLKDLFLKAGMILVDAKFEFGVTADGKVCLGDEISPDSCRIWDIETKEPLDKDRFRKNLGGVVDAYKEIARRLEIAIA